MGIASPLLVGQVARGHIERNFRHPDLAGK